MQKPVIFISDLHLGAGKANDFHKSFELHRLFDYAAENASELVLNGDILELLQSELTEVYLQHHALFRHLFDLARKIPVTYVVGNHDALVAVDYRAEAPSYFLGSPIIVTPEYTNKKLKLFAVHGHQHDLWNRREDMLDLTEGSTPGDRIARAAGWLERHLHPKMDNILENIYVDYALVLRRLLSDTQRFAAHVTPAHPAYAKLGGNYSEYAAGAKDVLRSERYSVCIFGHTHQQVIRSFTKEKDGCDGLYVNAGSWVGDDHSKTPPTFVEVSLDRVRVIDAETFEVLLQEERRDSKAKCSRVTARVKTKTAA